MVNDLKDMMYAAALIGAVLSVALIGSIVFLH